jgi:CHASE2 domain-containing sensor protein
MVLFSRKIVVSLLLLGSGLLGYSSFLERPDLAYYHILFDLRGTISPHKQLRIIKLDEASLQALGVWPLPRRIYAELIDGLMQAQAKLIGIDIAMPSVQNKTDDFILAQTFKKYPKKIVLVANFQPVEAGQGESLVLPQQGFYPMYSQALPMYPLMRMEPFIVLN